MQKPQHYTQWSLSPCAKKRIGKGGINEIRYFPDGTRLAVASTIGIWIYDVQTCKPLELIIGTYRTSQFISIQSGWRNVCDRE